MADEFPRSPRHSRYEPQSITPPLPPVAPSDIPSASVMADLFSDFGGCINPVARVAATGLGNFPTLEQTAENLEKRTRDLREAAARIAIQPKKERVVSKSVAGWINNSVERTKTKQEERTRRSEKRWQTLNNILGRADKQKGEQSGQGQMQNQQNESDKKIRVALQNLKLQRDDEWILEEEHFSDVLAAYNYIQRERQGAPGVSDGEIFRNIKSTVNELATLSGSENYKSLNNLAAVLDVLLGHDKNGKFPF